MKGQVREHAGHSIELKRSKGRSQLLIDGVPHGFGQLPNGKYYLDDYAYDWSDDLLDVAQRYIDHRRRADEIRNKTSAKSRRPRGEG
jgi:hypothetical protein